MKLGYSTWGMPNVPIDQAVKCVADLGYDGIEIAVLPNYTTSLAKMDKGERQRIKRLVKRSRLALPAIDAHRDMSVADEEAYKPNWEVTAGAVDLAVEWALDKPPVVITLTGGKPEQFDQLKALFVERLGKLAQYAASRGVTVALEPHVGGAVDRPDRALWLLQQVKAPNLKINCDYSHFQAMGWSAEETVPQLVPYTVHAHVKGAVGVYPDYRFVLPGEHDYDYAHYLRVMHKAGYDGFQSVEASYMVQRRPDYDPFAAAELCYKVLSKAFQDAGLPR